MRERFAACLPVVTAAAMALGLAGCHQTEAAAATPPREAKAVAAPAEAHGDARAEAPGEKPPACVAEPLAVEERLVLTRLRQRRLEIEARAVELDKKQKEIQAVERAAAALLDKVEAAKNQIEARLGVGRGSAEARAAQLARLTEALRSMKPKQAAELIGGLGPETAGPLLRSMGAADVARLLATLRADKAAELAELLIEAPAVAPASATRPPAEVPAKEDPGDQGS